MNESSHHPSDDQLKAFGLGDLDPQNSAKVEVHIEECHECSETLLGLSSSSDTFVSSLRRAGQSEQEASEPTPASQEETIALSLDAADSRLADDGLRDVPPQLLNHPRYRIAELVGKGGMGDVYKAEHKLMSRPVALKVINRKLVAHPRAVERFRREVQAAARLSHPNIVTAHDADQAGDVHFLVMEYVDGTDLSEVVRQRGPLPVAQACSYIQQAASGLQKAHELGLVHRDIKPHNLMVTGEGQVKILDFGLASFVSETPPEVTGESDTEPGPLPSRLTSMGSTMGTPDYISPEQAIDAGSVDIRSDIYSLGCTLYFLLTGNPPYPEGKLADKLKAHSEDEPQAVAEVRGDVPVQLVDTLRRMMTKKAADRFQTPAEVADALAPFRSAPTSTPSAANPARRRLLSAIALCFGLAAVAVAGFAIYTELDKGNIEIHVASELKGLEDVKVVLKQGGEAVATIPVAKISDPITYRHRSGEYEVRLQGGDGNIDLRVWSDGALVDHRRDQIKLDRNGRIRVELKLAARKETILVQDPERHPPVAVLRETVESNRFRPSCVEFSPRQMWLASGAGDGKIKLWTTNTDQAKRHETKELVTHGPQEVQSLAFSPDGKWLASATRQRGFRIDQVPVNPHLQNFGGPPRPIRGGSSDKFELPAQRAEVACVAFSPDSKTLATGVNKGVYFWDPQKRGSHQGMFSAHKGMVVCLTFSPDGETLVSGARDGTIRRARLHQDRSLGMVRDLEDPLAAHDNGVTALVFSPDGKWLISGGHDHLVKIWDATTGELRKTLKGHTKAVTALAVHPGGTIASSSEDGTVRLWRPTDGTLLQVIEEHTDQVRSVAFSPDGEVMATASWDKSIRIWDLSLPPNGMH